jgi:hypothetical protein
VSGCGGTLVGDTYTTGAISRSCAVTATFATNRYTVTPTAGANGRISPSAARLVNYNAKMVFVVNANQGYQIDTVTGCNGTLSGNIFTAGPITDNCTIEAKFISKP